MSEPAALRRMIETTNTEDRPGFLACFTEDAEVDDFGRVFRGHPAIQGWSDAENIGTHNRITLHDSESSANGDLRATISVTGQGYNGPGSFVVTTHEGRISRLVIRS